MQELSAVKDTGICMYAVSSPLGSKYRYADGGLYLNFNPCTQVFNPHSLLLLVRCPAGPVSFSEESFVAVNPNIL